MREVKPALTAIKIMLIVLWPISATAAQVSFGTGVVATVSLLSISVTLLLSTLSGLTSLLRQMLKDVKETGVIEHRALYIASNLLSSNTAGLLTLFLSEGRLDPNLQAGVIIMASLGGAVVLDRSVQALLSAGESFIKKRDE